MRRGFKLLKEENYPEAVKVFQCIMSNHPEEPRYLSAYGACLWRMDRREESLAAHRKALTLSGASPVSWRNVAEALTLMKRLNEAEPYWIEAKKLDGQNPEHSNGLAMVQRALGKKKEAEQTLHSAAVASQKSLCGVTGAELSRRQITHAQCCHAFGAYLGHEGRHVEALWYLEQAVAYDWSNSQYMADMKSTQFAHEATGEQPIAPTATAGQRFNQTLFKWDR